MLRTLSDHPSISKATRKQVVLLASERSYRQVWGSSSYFNSIFQTQAAPRAGRSFGAALRPGPVFFQRRYRCLTQWGWRAKKRVWVAQRVVGGHGTGKACPGRDGEVGVG